MRFKEPTAKALRNQLVHPLQPQNPSDNLPSTTSKRHSEQLPLIKWHEIEKKCLAGSGIDQYLKCLLEIERADPQSASLMMKIRNGIKSYFAEVKQKQV